MPRHPGYAETAVERLVPEKLTVVEFPGFRWIYGTRWPMPEDTDTGWGIRDKDYERHLEGSNTDFLFQPWRDVPWRERLTPISAAYLHHYVHSSYLEPDYKNLFGNVKSLANSGALGNFVTDSTAYDGYMYDIQDLPVYRGFRMELAEGHGYRVTRIANDLIKIYGHRGRTTKYPTHFGLNNARVCNLSVDDVPYYNQDSMGCRVLVFTYYPANYAAFQALYDADIEDGSFSREGKILDLLGLKRPQRSY
jgi:hypothetical protein